MDEFVENIVKIIDEFNGVSLQKLAKNFNVNSSAKNGCRLVVDSILSFYGISKDDIEENHILLKVIRYIKTRVPEAISLPAFSFEEVYATPRENSKLRKTFLNSTLLIVLFKEINDEYYLSGCAFHKFTFFDVETKIKQVYDATRNILASGNIVNDIIVDKKGKKYLTNFPKEKYDKIIHVRPHARNFEDAYDLPVKDSLTGFSKYQKHCFWINRSFIENILKEFKLI